MSTQFKEYKGLDLPTVASEVLDFWKKQQIFEKSVTTREGNQPFVFLKVRRRPTVCRESTT
jgi:isoleucyl-tRNA synthetase